MMKSGAGDRQPTLGMVKSGAKWLGVVWGAFIPDLEW